MSRKTKCFGSSKMMPNLLLFKSLSRMKNNRIVLLRNINFFKLSDQTGALTSCGGHKSFEPIKGKIKLTPTLTQPITKLV